ncbi:vitamin D3 receptor-like [Oppia nitens]|uniref:vitamin D3 receptor-like n=1 Tax=Oppia nitens TaxID=1686743 RepID=UPI0023DB36B5|nr:vitamin D3 receptor-like [Oppia nitens]
MSDNIENTLQLYCVVCGDKSNGYHFDVQSCNSCKAFFRRNALKYQDRLRCYFGGKCTVDIDSRTHCRKCRLDKCFSMGMKTNLFYTDDENQVRRAIVRENRKRKLVAKVDDNDDNNDNSWPTPTPVNRRSEIIGDYSQQQLPSSVITTTNSETIDRNNKSQTTIGNDMLSTDDDDNDDDEDDNNSIDSELTIKLLSPQSPTPTPTLVMVADYGATVDGGHCFTDGQSQRFRQLLDSMNCLQTTGHYSRQLRMTCIHESIHIQTQKFSNDLPKYVQMAKSLDQFRDDLEESDQLILIKYSALELVVLRNILNFNFEHLYWNIIHENTSYIINLDLYKQISEDPDIGGPYTLHKTFLTEMGIDWDFDKLIIYLLTPILLFNPNRPKLLNRDHIEKQREFYKQLLKCYLNCKYQSVLLSDAKLDRLLDSLKHLTILSNRVAYFSKFANNFNYIQFPEIFQEIVTRDD